MNRKTLLIIDFRLNQISQQLPMNLSYKQSGDFQTVLQWMHQFPYPNCQKVSNLASLRNGVAIAQVLVDKLPSSMHPLFLPNIEIYNTNPQRCILNLKVLINTLKHYYANDKDGHSMLQQFNGEGLYFDHNMMETFIYTVLMPLGNDQQQDLNIRENHYGLQQVSDIANLSSIIVHNQQTKIQPKQPIKINHQRKDQSPQTSKQNSQMIKIKKWLLETHYIDCNENYPEQIIGKLVNSIFAGSRLDHTKIVKQSHYELGSIAVFKKVCDYLLECERMPKQNVLAMVEEVELGSIREQIFWSVIEDLMNLKISHNIKTNQSSRKKSIAKTQDQNSNKENSKKQSPNIVLMKSSSKEKKKTEIMGQYSAQTIEQVQNWIKNDLGYQYSLNKSKSAVKAEQNPLLNGVLLGSIVMRMQIGKVNTIKQPKNKKQIQKNLSQITNCIIRRGIEAGRKLNYYKPTYKNYLGAIWDIKEEYYKKAELEKMRRLQKNRQKKHMKELTSAQRESLTQWLQQKGIQLQNNLYLSAVHISQICGEVLELRLLRQTTPRIKELNMIKILQEVRRLGWQYECTYQQMLSSQGNSLRWNLLKFTHELLKYKVYYYR